MPTCRACRQTIEWIRMASGRMMPIDPGPSLRGTIAIRNGVGIKIPETTPSEPGEALYVSHMVTCPSDRYKRRREN